MPAGAHGALQQLAVAIAVAVISTISSVRSLTRASWAAIDRYLLVELGLTAVVRLLTWTLPARARGPVPQRLASAAPVW